MPPVVLSLIVAVAENGVIGRDNGLPWHLPDDLQHFRRVTLGKPVLMGRKTYESIGRPLPKRHNIVVTRDAAFCAEGVCAVRSVADGLQQAVALAARDGVDEVVIIGGAAIYAAALPFVSRLHITQVHATIEGDTLLPTIDWAQWREISREYVAAATADGLAFSFVRYERTTQPKNLP